MQGARPGAIHELRAASEKGHACRSPGGGNGRPGVGGDRSGRPHVTLNADAFDSARWSAGQAAVEGGVPGPARSTPASTGSDGMPPHRQGARPEHDQWPPLRAVV